MESTLILDTCRLCLYMIHASAGINVEDDTLKEPFIVCEDRDSRCVRERWPSMSKIIETISNNMVIKTC